MTLKIRILKIFLVLSLSCSSIITIAADLDFNSSCEFLDALSERDLREIQKKVPIPISIFEGKIRTGLFRLDEFDRYDPNALYIGVANYQNIGIHHYYMIAGNKRFDGGERFKLARIREKGINAKPPGASEGVVFKLAVSKEQLEIIKENMIEMRRLTCLHGICDILKKAEIEILPSGHRVSGNVVAAGFLSGSIKNKNGSKIPMEVIASSEYQLRHFISTARTIDKMAALETVSFALTTSPIWGGPPSIMFMALSEAAAKQ